MAAVERVGRLQAQALQLLALELELRLLQPVLGEHRPVGVDDDDVRVTVDDQDLAVADHPARVVRRHHRRHVEPARDDRGVRRRPAEVGQERAVAVRLELDDVRGRQVVGDEDRLFLGGRRRQRARAAHQPLQHALDHLHDVRAPLAQVRILDLVELLDQHRHLLGQRPLGVAALLGDDLLRHLGERGVVEDHPVHVEERAELAGDVLAGHRPVQRLQFLLHLVDRSLEARHLGADLRGGNRVVRDLERRVRDELGAADRDAARHPDAVDGEAHHGAAPIRRRARPGAGGRRPWHAAARSACHGQPPSPK